MENIQLFEREENIYYLLILEFRFKKNSFYSIKILILLKFYFILAEIKRLC